MATIKSVYNEIGIATDDVVEIISDYFSRGNLGKYLDSSIEGGYEKWKADMKKYEEDYDFIDGPLKTGYNEMHAMGILENRPELYVRLALAKMKTAREKGYFDQLSDKEFDSLVDEFQTDPSNFTPAKRRAISIKYDKALQQDIASRKELEEWTKRQWQHRAGIIK